MEYRSKNNNVKCKRKRIMNDAKELRGDFSGLDIDQWLDWYAELKKDEEQHAKDGHNFNIFHLLKKEFDFKIQETMHSKLLKFLLDSKETHGCGNLFLIEFLTLLGIKSPEVGEWNVKAEQGKIDILIQRKNPCSVVIIENKSNWAPDQKNQLYRYWYEQIYLKTKETSEQFYEKNKGSYQIVYLSPDSSKRYDDQSIYKHGNEFFAKEEALPDRVPMDIVLKTFDEDIPKWLENCKAKLSPTNHRIREYISQYQMLCKKNIEFMNEEFLTKAMDLFNSSEKWNAFCELMIKKGDIQHEWWKKLQSEIYEKEEKNFDSEWKSQRWKGDGGIIWWINGYSEYSLYIYFYENMLKVNYDGGALDVKAVKELLKDPRFDVIRDAFDKFDDYDDGTLGWEEGNFSFNTKWDKHFSIERLAWYAGHETEKFADQIIAKVRKFQTKEITKLFKEINDKCKKQH